MQYFDSYAFIGKRQLDDLEEPWSLQQVQQLMDRCGIDAALVYHTLARDYSPDFGNQILQLEIRNNPRFFGCYVALPQGTDEMAEASTWVSRLRADNFYAVKIFPTTYHFEMNNLTVEPFLSALEMARIPLLIDITEINFQILADMAQQYPQLPILVQKLTWGNTRQILPLFTQYKNLYLEFSSYQVFCVLEWLTRKYGAERLVFGSEMPLKTPGAARALIDYADLTSDQKALIASGNLMRLLNIPKLPAVTFKPQDEFVARAQAGQPVNHILVIDAHSHIGHENFRGASSAVMPESDPGLELKKFDRLGVAKVCVSTWVGIWQDSVLGNELLETIIKKYPNQYIPYVTIDPTYLNETQINDVIQKYHVKLKYPGLKPYFPRQRYPLTGAGFKSWFKFANANNLFALIHYDNENTVKEVETLALEFPNLIFIIAHAGSSYKAARNIIRLIQKDKEKFKNVYAEITFTAVLSNVIEILVREIGADRVLFGTDAPMRDPAPQLGWVLYANIPPADKRKILGENMSKILARTAWK